MHHRVQFDVDGDTLVMLDQLGATSRAEVIRRALRLLAFSTTPGQEVILRDREGFEKTLKFF